MALTLRPTDLNRSPATADLEDWIALEDGKPIGRIYQRHAPANADVAWFWSITEYVAGAGGRRPRLKLLFMMGYSRNAIVHRGRLDAVVDVIHKSMTHLRWRPSLRGSRFPRLIRVRVCARGIG